MQRSEARASRNISAWPAWLVAAAIALQLTVSGNALSLAGVHYVSDGGVIFEKIHPATYLCGAAALVEVSLILWHRFCGSTPFRFSLADASFVIGTILAISYAICMNGGGAAIALIDTFLAPALAWFVLKRSSSAPEGLIQCVLCAGVLIDAVLCIAEALIGLHFMPPAEPILDREFRPMGLLDHPLTAAVVMMTAAILAPAVLKSSIWLRTLPALACVVCEGRAAALGMIAAAICLVYPSMKLRILKRTLSLEVAASAIAFSLIAILVVTAAATAGLMDRIATHGVWDASADTRVDEFAVLTRLDAVQLCFGVRRDDLIAVLANMKLMTNVGVLENFWLLIFCNLGLLVFPLFAILFLQFIIKVGASAGRAGMIAVITFVAVCSFSNSLGRKSPALLIFVGLCWSYSRSNSDHTMRANLLTAGLRNA